MTEAAHDGTRRMSLKQFVRWDGGGGDRRHELHDGVVVAMNPPSPAHGLIVHNLSVAVAPLLASGCVLVVDAGIVPSTVGDSYYVADAATTCEPLQAEQVFVPAPDIIFEVLSASTLDFDLGIKTHAYRGMDSVREIVMISSVRVHAMLWSREDEHWHIRDLIGRESRLMLATLGGALPLAALYANVPLQDGAEEPGAD